jgi:hypothetical protein
MKILFILSLYLLKFTNGFYGVVVSTLDFESSDLGSTPGRTYLAGTNNNFYILQGLKLNKFFTSMENQQLRLYILNTKCNHSKEE